MKSPASRTATAAWSLSTRPNWRPIARSRCAGQRRTATISISLPFRATRCTPRSAPGVLMGNARLLSATPPDEIGGGTVEFVTAEHFDLASEAFRRENSGTPNAVGIVAMAVAAEVLKHAVGFAAIQRHEQDLLDAARLRLPPIEGLRVLGDLDYSARRKCAILSFALDGHPHALLAARLSHEFGIGVRHGHLCQFAYVAGCSGYRRRMSLPFARKCLPAAAKRCTASCGRASASATVRTTSSGSATPWRRSPPRPNGKSYTFALPQENGCPKACHRSTPRSSFAQFSRHRVGRLRAVCRPPP